MSEPDVPGIGTTEPERYRSVAGAYAGFTSEDRIYLQRVFHCVPGGAPRFAEYYQSTLPERHAISASLQPVGAWQTVYGPAEEVIHMYEFSSLSALQSDLDLLLANQGPDIDPPPGIDSRSSKLMRGLPYCPSELVATDALPAPDNRISMFMAVFCTRTGVGDFVDNFNDGIEQRRKISPQLVPAGAWRNLYGARYYELNHIYSYQSLADMEEMRRLMFRDSSFMDRVKINTSPLPPNFWEWGGASKLMKPLAYSRMR